MKPLEARARAVFEHMQKVWIKVNVPFTEYSGLRSEWDELVRAAGVVHERVAVAGQQAAAAINAGTEAMVPVNEYFSSLAGGAVTGGVAARGVRSTASRAVSAAAGGVSGAPRHAVRAAVDGLGVAAGAVTSVPQQITARGQQLAAQVTGDGIKVGDQILTDPTSPEAQKLVRDGLATNILGVDPTGVPTAMMMLAAPSTLLREQPRKKPAGRRWTGADSKAQSVADRAVGQVVSVPGRFVGGAVDRFGNTIAGNAALVGVGGDPVRAWSGLLSNAVSPVAGASRAVASATPAQILTDPIAAAGAAATHAPATVPFVGWVYGLVEWASKPGELAREGAKETLASALDTLTLKNLEAGQQVANTGEVQVTTSDVDVHADHGGYVTFTLPDLEGGEPKAWYILATPDSPGNFTTDVATGPGEELVERSDGSVILVNSGSGQIARTIKTPWAKDALGRDQPTWYSIEKIDDQTSTITQHIAPNKNALYPLVADAPVSGEQAATIALSGLYGAAGVSVVAQQAVQAPAPASPEVQQNPAAVLPGGTQRLLDAGTYRPESQVSVQLPQTGGAAGGVLGPSVGRVITQGGGQVTASPNASDGAVKIETPRNDGSGTSGVTAVSTVVRPGSEPGVIGTGSGNVRVTDATVSVRDERTGVEAVTGTGQQVEDAGAVRPTTAGGLTPQTARTISQSMPALASMLTISPADGAVSVRTPTDTGAAIPTALTSPNNGGASLLLAGVGAVNSGHGTVALPGSDGRITERLPGGSGTQTTLPDMTQITDHTDPVSKVRTLSTTDLITGAVNSVRTDPATKITERWTVDGTGAGQVTLSQPGSPTQTYRVAGDRIVVAAPRPLSLREQFIEDIDQMLNTDEVISNPQLRMAMQFQAGRVEALYNTVTGLFKLTPIGTVVSAADTFRDPATIAAAREHRWGDLAKTSENIFPQIGMFGSVWQTEKDFINTNSAALQVLANIRNGEPVRPALDQLGRRAAVWGNGMSKLTIGTDFQDPHKTLPEKLGSADVGVALLIAPVKGASAAKTSTTAARLETGIARAEADAARTTQALTTPRPTPTTSKPAIPLTTPLETPKPHTTITPTGIAPAAETAPKAVTPTPGPNYKPFTTTPAAERAGAGAVKPLDADTPVPGPEREATSGTDASKTADTPAIGDKTSSPVRTGTPERSVDHRSRSSAAEHNNSDAGSSYKQRIDQTPVNNGRWMGERGESMWISSNSVIERILRESGVDGIRYRNGQPDFGPVAKGQVEIPNMTTNRDYNFKAADKLLAKEWGVSPRDVAEWRSKNKYTWHEEPDLKTMQLGTLHS